MKNKEMKERIEEKMKEIMDLYHTSRYISDYLDTLDDSEDVENIKILIPKVPILNADDIDSLDSIIELSEDRIDDINEVLNYDGIQAKVVKLRAIKLAGCYVAQYIITSVCE